MKLLVPDAARLFSWCCVLTVLVLSLLPGDYRPHTALPNYAEHFLAYAITGLFFSFGYRKVRERFAIWALLGAYSFLMEFAQRYVPGRSPALRDAVASTIGLTLGLMIGAALVRALTALRPSNAG